MSITANSKGIGGERLDGRIALVTGASRGIGHAAAKALAAAGAHVIAVARTVGGLEALDDAIRDNGANMTMASGGRSSETDDDEGGAGKKSRAHGSSEEKKGGKGSDSAGGAGAGASLVPLDLGDGEGIERLAQSIGERWGRLDILVANAGRLGVLAPLGHIPPQEWARTLDINLNANWRLIRAFEPLLLRSDAGRAIFTTSGAARKCKAYWGVYSVSKAALEALVATWVAETQSSSLRINLLSPGPTRTAMRARAMPGEDQTELPTAESIAPLFVHLASPSCHLHGEILGRDALLQRAGDAGA